jgi:hypothetical protein
MQTESPIHSVYLPFTTAQLRSHFAPVDSRSAEELESHIRYFLDSATRYKQFCDEFPDRCGINLTKLKTPCQTEKDERFWGTSCWLSVFYSANRLDVLCELMRRCFGDKPPIAGFADWRACFAGTLYLYFEAHLPSPQSYRQWLWKNIKERNVVPYVIAAAQRRNRNLEGPTHADVLLINADNGLALLVEAKGVSDISYDVSFDLMRNQLARNIDVSLERNETLPFPLSVRDPERTLVILQTP